MRASSLLFLLTLPVLAQSPEASRFGLQGGLAFPLSVSTRDITDGSVGFTLGGQLTWDRVKGQRFRARLDYTAFPEKDFHRPGAVYRSRGTLKGLAAGIDYLYFLEGKPQGAYLCGGLSINQWKLDATTFYTTGQGSEGTTKTGPGVAVGAGWQFNRNLGLELRATWSKWEWSREQNNAVLAVAELNYRF